MEYSLDTSIRKITFWTIHIYNIWGDVTYTWVGRFMCKGPPRWMCYCPVTETRFNTSDASYIGRNRCIADPSISFNRTCTYYTTRFSRHSHSVDGPIRFIESHLYLAEMSRRVCQCVTIQSKMNNCPGELHSTSATVCLPVSPSWVRKHFLYNHWFSSITIRSA